MQRVTLKTSTIFIAKGGKTRVYYSVGDVPDDLRRELEESTNGFNSATILIADRRGREEIRRALNGMPSALRTRLANSMPAAPQQAESADVPESESNWAMKLKWPLTGLALPFAGILLWYLLGNQ
jgi:hypothetical protein